MRDDSLRMADDLPLAERWRLARDLAKRSQKAAAAELGVERGSIARVENGTKKVPPAYVLWAIVIWRTPERLLDADDLVPGDSDAAGQRFLARVRKQLDRWQSESPEAQDAP